MDKCVNAPSGIQSQIALQLFLSPVQVEIMIECTIGSLNTMVAQSLTPVCTKCFLLWQNHLLKFILRMTWHQLEDTRPFLFQFTSKGKCIVVGMWWVFWHNREGPIWQTNGIVPFHGAYTEARYINNTTFGRRWLMLGMGIKACPYKNMISIWQRLSPLLVTGAIKEYSKSSCHLQTVTFTNPMIYLPTLTQRST